MAWGAHTTKRVAAYGKIGVEKFPCRSVARRLLFPRCRENHDCMNGVNSINGFLIRPRGRAVLRVMHAVCTYTVVFVVVVVLESMSRHI